MFKGPGVRSRDVHFKSEKRRRLINMQNKEVDLTMFMEYFSDCKCDPKSDGKNPMHFK